MKWFQSTYGRGLTDVEQCTTPVTFAMVPCTRMYTDDDTTLEATRARTRLSERYMVSRADPSDAARGQIGKRDQRLVATSPVSPSGRTRNCNMLMQHVHFLTVDNFQYVKYFLKNLLETFITRPRSEVRATVEAPSLERVPDRREPGKPQP